MTTEQAKTMSDNGQDDLGGYTFEVMEELPMGAPKRSRLEEVIEKVKTLPTNKPICLRHYEKASTATAAANNFKMRWGAKPEAYGFIFKTRRLEDNDYGLFVIYDPAKIVPGAKDEVDARYNEFRVKQAEKNKEREVAKAKKEKAASNKTNAK